MTPDPGQAHEVVVERAAEREERTCPLAEMWYADITPSDAEFVAGVRLAFIKTPDGGIAWGWSFDGPLEDVGGDVAHALFKLGAEAGEYVMARVAERVVTATEPPELKPGEMRDG